MGIFDQEQETTSLSLIDQNIENVESAWVWAVKQHHVDLIEKSIRPFAHYLSIRSLWAKGEYLFNIARTGLAPEADAIPQVSWLYTLSRHYGSSPERTQQLQMALRWAEKRDDQTEIAHCLTELGWISENPETALSYFEKSFAIEVSDSKYSTALGGMARCHFILNNIHQAHYCNGERIKYAFSQSSDAVLAAGLNMRGCIDLYLGHVQSAQMDFNEALHISEHTKNPLELYESHFGLFWVAILNGNKNELQKIHEIILDILDDTQFFFHINTPSIASLVTATFGALTKQVLFKKSFNQLSAPVWTDFLPLIMWTPFSLVALSLSFLQTDSAMAKQYLKLSLQKAQDIESVSLFAMCALIAKLLGYDACALEPSLNYAIGLYPDILTWPLFSDIYSTGTLDDLAEDNLMKHINYLREIIS